MQSNYCKTLQRYTLLNKRTKNFGYNYCFLKKKRKTLQGVALIFYVSLYPNKSKIT